MRRCMIRQRTLAAFSVSGHRTTGIQGGFGSLRLFAASLDRPPQTSGVTVEATVLQHSSSAEKPSSTSRQQPRASNPASHQRNFFVPDDYHEGRKHVAHPSNRKVAHNVRLTSGSDRQNVRQTKPSEYPSHSVSQQRPPPRSIRHAAEQTLRTRMPMTSNATRRCGGTLGHHLKEQGETVMPTSTWIQVQGISPISSLEAMLAGIHEVLDTEEALGMIDLDALWSVGQAVPFLPPLVITSDNADEQVNKTNDTPDKWVRKARVILSPFGRPTGWYMQFDNRSVVYALLKHAEENPVQCTWKTIKVQEYQGRLPGGDTNVPISHGNLLVNEHVSDHTLRVENCPPSVNDISLLNFFSRYDLQFGEQAVQRWEGVTSDGKKCPPTTCLVHFADASWARAALREKQATFIQKFGKRIVPDESNPQPLRLIQYPRQIL